MGILSLFRNLRRKTESRRPEAPPVTPAPARPAAPATQKGASPVFTGLAGRSVLIHPVITEKATLLSSVGRYVFRVTPEATKTEIRRAVENLFGVHVAHVRLVKLPAKLRRRGNIVGSVSGSRKALVTLREGEHIDLTTAVPFGKDQPTPSPGRATPGVPVPELTK